MLKIGDNVEYVGDKYNVLLNLEGVIVEINGIKGLVYYNELLDRTLISEEEWLHNNNGKYEEEKYAWIELKELELINTNKGEDNMIKAGDLVKVLNAEGTTWEVGTIGTVDRVVNGVARVFADGYLTTNEMFAVENLEKVVEKKAVFPKEIFNVGDRVMANCTSDKGNYRLGDVGTVTKFRDDEDGADVGVQFDHKKETITTWVYPENIVHLDLIEDELEPEPVEYGKIKIFNLTSLRKKGWEFDNQGNLNLSGTEKSMSGLMLNIIDGEFMAYEDACEDNIYIVGEDGIEYVIDKALKGKLFKKI